MITNKAKLQAGLLKVFGNPIRVQILVELEYGDRCVNDLLSLSTICESNLSRHLSYLKRVGLVTERRAGPRVIHHLACPAILQVLKCADEAHRAVKARREKES